MVAPFSVFGIPNITAAVATCALDKKTYAIQNTGLPRHSPFVSLLSGMRENTVLFAKDVYNNAMFHYGLTHL